MEEVFYSDDYLTLYYDEDTSTVRAVWNGFLSGDIMRQAVMQCLQLLDEKKPVAWLADNRKLKAIRQKDQEWIAQYVMPRLALSSLRRLATLISDDIFSQMAVENLYTNASEFTRFDHRYFKDSKSAEKWLLERSDILQ